MIFRKGIFRLLAGPLAVAALGAYGLISTATKVTAGQLNYTQWTGEGDGTTWEDPFNWRTGDGTIWNGSQWVGSASPNPDPNGGPSGRWALGLLVANTDAASQAWPTVNPVVSVNALHTLAPENGFALNGGTINIGAGGGLTMTANSYAPNGLEHDARFSNANANCCGTAWSYEAGVPSIINITGGGLFKAPAMAPTNNASGAGTYGNMIFNVTDDGSLISTGSLAFSAPAANRSGIGALHITGYDPASVLTVATTLSFQGLSTAAQSGLSIVGGSGNRSGTTGNLPGTNIAGAPPTPYAAEFDVTLDVTDNTRGTNAGGSNMPLFDTMVTHDLTIQNGDSGNGNIGSTYPTHFSLTLSGYNPVAGDIIALITSTDAINSTAGTATDNAFFNEPWNTPFVVSGDTFQLLNLEGSTNGVFLDVIAVPSAGPSVPEPSTLALGLLGMVGIGLCGWIRRRTQKAR